MGASYEIFGALSSYDNQEVETLFPNNHRKVVTQFRSKSSNNEKFKMWLSENRNTFSVAKETCHDQTK
jgi:hypothetical protein